MKLVVILFFSVLCISSIFAQTESSFQSGEWFQFKVSYSGFVRAGTATLSLEEKEFEGKSVFHVTGKGWTTGAVKWFFKVNDHYESFFDKANIMPYKFIRKIDEGGHTRDIEIKFDHQNNTAVVNNIKRNNVKTVAIEDKVQDLVSAFYYLRNNYDTKTIRRNDVIKLNMFFSYENYEFKLKFLGKETLKTTINGARVKVKALKFRPYVMAGRVFKEQESLTVWVSDDKNKIPLKLKADLAVGSLRADLEAFKGLKHSFKIQI